MSSKGRSRQSGVPLALVGMTNGVGRSAVPAEADRESTWPALREDVVPPKSSPSVSVRPPAPELSFGGGAAAAPAESSAREEITEAARDDVSVPPVGVDHVDHVDHGFFDTDIHHLSDAADLDTRDPKAVLKRSQAMVVRRAHLTKYVTATMGVALALCLVALVKTAMTGNTTGDKAARAESLPQGASTVTAPVDPTPTTAQAPSPPAAAAVSAPAESAAAQAQGAPAATETAAPTQAPAADSVAVTGQAAPPANPPAAADPPKPSEPVAAAAPAEPTPPAPPQPTTTPVQAAQAPQPPPATATITTTQPAAAATAAGAATTSATSAVVANTGASASREKEHARAALERSSLVESIGAGERSVALDPTDAEAWLILGAAYQARGDARNASRCFKSCIDRSTHGPKGECAAMLH
jgi:hypothetical protein